MLYIKLFWSFVKIGFTSFGGLSMIPLISSEMISHNWMTAHEVSDIVAIAEMTPGPLGLNCATFAGMKAGGLLGAFFANMGALSPTFILSTLAAMFFAHFKDSKYLNKIMIGVRPACIGMVGGVLLQLSGANFTDIVTGILGIADLILLIKFKFSIPKVLLLNAIAGIILFRVFEF